MHWAEEGLGPEICPLSIMSGFDTYIFILAQHYLKQKGGWRGVLGVRSRWVGLLMDIIGAMIKDLNSLMARPE